MLGVFTCMTVADLQIPEALVSLIESGRWPRDAKEATCQNLELRVPVERIRRFAPEEHWLYLCAPPFGKPADVFSRLVDFRGEPDNESPPGDIDYDRAIVIGDFGLGSDAPIALDYRRSLDCPSVIRYRWSHRGERNRWVYLARSFSQFAEMLEL
jgi:hypothetical protein